MGISRSTIFQYPSSKMNFDPRKWSREVKKFKLHLFNAVSLILNHFNMKKTKKKPFFFKRRCPLGTPTSPSPPPREFKFFWVFIWREHLILNYTYLPIDFQREFLTLIQIDLNWYSYAIFEKNCSRRDELLKINKILKTILKTMVL